MIFKHLFTPKHRHPNEAVRAQAIESLSLDDPKQKSQLHELAFNDESHQVRYKALQKLDNFALWWKVVQTDKDEFIRKKANEIVERELVDDVSAELTKVQKTFLLESSNRALLEKVFQQRLIGSSDSDFTLKLLDKLAKPELNRKVIVADPESVVAQRLFEQMDDESELTKLARKLGNSELLTRTNEKLALIKQSKEKPYKLEKDTRLVLAKLLALKEEKQFDVLRDQKEQLCREFEGYEAEFACLNSELSAEFLQKYQGMILKLSERFHALEQTWMSEQAYREAREQFASIEPRIDLLVDAISVCMNDGVEQVTIEQIAQFKATHSELVSAINAINKDYLSQKDISKLLALFNRLNASQVTLDRLPHFQQALVKAQAVLIRFEETSIPEGSNAIELIQQLIKDMRNQWWEVKAGFADTWPKGLNSRFEVVMSRWQVASKHVLSAQKERLSKCRNKFNFVQKLIDEGKYHKAMEIYQTAVAMYEQADASTRLKIERQYLKLKDQVENLQDWQHYLASPRRPELKDQIKALVELPLSIDEQAKQVKLLRQQWNSLGRLDQHDEQEIEFNQLVEQAFAPCREFYAQQQQERDNNLASKEALITEFAQLNDSQMPMEDVTEHYRNLIKKWKEVGNVDFKMLDGLNDKFQNVVTPLKRKIDAFQRANAEQKQALIDKVTNLDLTDLEFAVEQAKQSQEAWKSIGFAGRKHDQGLWQSFRQANDKIFAARQTQLDESKQALQAKIDIIEVAFDSLEDLFANYVEQTQNDALISDALSELAIKIQQLDKKVQTKWFKKLDEKQSQLKNLSAQRQTKKTQQAYQLIFDCLNSWHNEQLPAHLEQLPTSWQLSFKEATSITDSRHILTVKLELVCGASTPKGDEALRKDVQLSMMASKLSHGEVAEKDLLLAQWIACGPVSKEDLGLLERIKPLFLE